VRSVWLIRAGQASALAKAFEDHEVVAIGWPELVDDLRSLSRWEIVDRLERAHVSTPDQDADELLMFRDQVVAGDLVVTPDTPNRDYLVGQVVGGYELRTSSPLVDPEHGRYAHVRRVDWWGRGDRDLLIANLRKELDHRRTIRMLPGAAEWHRLGGLVRDEGRRGPRTKVATPRTTSPRKPAAPKTPAAATPTDRTCPRCGLRKPRPQYIATSEVCADCRAVE
jgi:predicted Mrr-cat superfamily restriction endonuclease